MATKKKTSVPPDKLELYERLLEAADIDSKSNFGSAYTAINGNMYSMISKYGVVGIRLPTSSARPSSRSMSPRCSAPTRLGHHPGNW